jgi:proteasome lid subunit RPN8/RPN11
MLQLTKEQLDRIVAQGREGKPLEICGLMAGKTDGESTLVTEIYPAESDDKSELTYTVNARDYMHAEKAARQAGTQLIGIYHTHPATQPYPSPTDVRQAHWGESDDLTFPGFSYLIVSLRDVENPEARSYKIEGRRIPEDIREEPVLIV